MCISVLVYLSTEILSHESQKKQWSAEYTENRLKAIEKRLCHSSSSSNGLSLCMYTHNDNNNNGRIIMERLEIRCMCACMHEYVYWNEWIPNNWLDEGWAAAALHVYVRIETNRRTGKLKSKIGQAHALEMMMLLPLMFVVFIIVVVLLLLPLCYHVKILLRCRQQQKKSHRVPRKKGDIITFGFAWHIIFHLVGNRQTNKQTGEHTKMPHCSTKKRKRKQNWPTTEWRHTYYMSLPLYQMRSQK